MAGASRPLLLSFSFPNKPPLGSCLDHEICLFRLRMDLHCFQGEYVYSKLSTVLHKLAFWPYVLLTPSSLFEAIPPEHILPYSEATGFFSPPTEICSKQAIHMWSLVLFQVIGTSHFHPEKPIWNCLVQFSHFLSMKTELQCKIMK